MFANFITAISSSTAITLALFYVMNLLIIMQPQAAVVAEERNPIMWLERTIKDTPAEIEEWQIHRELTEPPQPPVAQAPGDPAEGTAISKPRGVVLPIEKFQTAGPLIQDGPLVALVRVSPTYPARAQQVGLEGWVLVEFDVLSSGAVTNVRIVDSSDRMFEDAARNAAKRFRFKPRIIQGVAQETSGVQNLFTFRMEN
jgi:protein TonB